MAQHWLVTLAIFLGIVVVVLTGAGGTYIWRDPATTVANKAVFIGTVITTLVAGISALLSGWAAERQRQNQLQLVELRATFQQRLVELQALLQHLTPLEIEAYAKLWAAASRYYRALAPLEEGQFDDTAIKAAEQFCKEAEEASLPVLPEHTVIFDQYIQEARFVRERE